MKLGDQYGLLPPAMLNCPINILSNFIIKSLIISLKQLITDVKYISQIVEENY